MCRVWYTCTRAEEARKEEVVLESLIVLSAVVAVGGVAVPAFIRWAVNLPTDNNTLGR